MCGIIGVSINNIKESDLSVIKNVFLESEIRGKHASGIVWWSPDNTLNLIREPMPISKLLKKINFEDFIYDGSIRVIGHTRYSTSNIIYNQPIYDKDLSICHNGVVTHLEPKSWESQLGYECETENDSELILRCILGGGDINNFPGISYSLVSLSKYGELKYYRNGLRPQWVGKLDNGVIIASTHNILMRAGIDNNRIFKVEPFSDEKQIRYMRGKYGEQRIVY